MMSKWGGGRTEEKNQPLHVASMQSVLTMQQQWQRVQHCKELYIFFDLLVRWPELETTLQSTIY